MLVQLYTCCGGIVCCYTNQLHLASSLFSSHPHSTFRALELWRGERLVPESPSKRAACCAAAFSGQAIGKGRCYYMCDTNNININSCKIHTWIDTLCCNPDNVMCNIPPCPTLSIAHWYNRENNYSILDMQLYYDSHYMTWKLATSSSNTTIAHKYTHVPTSTVACSCNFGHVNVKPSTCTINVD